MRAGPDWPLCVSVQARECTLREFLRRAIAMRDDAIAVDSFIAFEFADARAMHKPIGCGDIFWGQRRSPMPHRKTSGEAAGDHADEYDSNYR